MNTRTLTICFISIALFFTATADHNCEFLRPPRPIKRVSTNPTTPFKIRFTLRENDEFCLLRVKIPRDTLVTFNLTRSLEGGRQNYPGDSLGNEMYITRNKKTLVIVNVGEEFGSRFGRYRLNQQEVYGVPYHESVHRAIQDRSCSDRQGGSFDMRGKIKTTRAFQRCLQYNKEKGKKKEDYLFCQNCKAEPTFNEDNTSLSFDMKNLTGSEQAITCQIKTDDDRVNYILRILPSCPNV